VVDETVPAEQVPEFLHVLKGLLAKKDPAVEEHRKDLEKVRATLQAVVAHDKAPDPK